jgi:hypothetical protein
MRKEVERIKNVSQHESMRGVSGERKGRGEEENANFG